MPPLFCTERPAPRLRHGRPQSRSPQSPRCVIALDEAVEGIAQSLGPVELVARERYVLFRTPRIFADPVILSDAVRIAVCLPREASSPLFLEIVHGPRQVTLVAKL